MKQITPQRSEEDNQKAVGESADVQFPEKIVNIKMLQCYPSKWYSHAVFGMPYYTYVLGLTAPYGFILTKPAGFDDFVLRGLTKELLDKLFAQWKEAIEKEPKSTKLLMAKLENCYNDFLILP